MGEGRGGLIDVKDEMSEVWEGGPRDDVDCVGDGRGREAEARDGEDGEGFFGTLQELAEDDAGAIDIESNVEVGEAKGRQRRRSRGRHFLGTPQLEIFEAGRHERRSKS